jgi:hypothetical protein
MTIEETLISAGKEELQSFPRCGINFAAVLAYAKGQKEAVRKRKHLLYPLFASLAASAVVLSIALPLSLNRKVDHPDPISPLSVAPLTLREQMIQVGEVYFHDVLASRELKILDDYGQIGDLYIARIGGWISDATYHTETVGPVKFGFGDQNSIRIFDGKMFYTMKDAYRSLLLSSKQIQTIKDWFVGIHPWCNPDNPKDFPGGSELYGDPIVLEDKTAWDGNFAATSSLNQIDVTIDWNFNAHHFTSADFALYGVENVSCTGLTSEYFTTYPKDYPVGVNHRYRLLFATSGEEAIRDTIANLMTLDFVKGAAPAEVE